MPDCNLAAFISVRSFVKSTILVLWHMVLFAIPQCMLMSVLKWEDHIFYTLMCFFVTFLLLTVIHLSETLKYEWPWNWGAVFCCYQLTTIGLGTFVMNTNLDLTMQAVSFALLVYGFMLVLCFFLLIGSYSYPSPYKLAACGVVGLLLVIGIMIVYTIYQWQYCVDLAIILFILSMLSVMVSYVLISFKNQVVLMKADVLLVGFMLYLNYVLILITTLVSFKRLTTIYNVGSYKSGQKASP